MIFDHLFYNLSTFYDVQIPLVSGTHHGFTFFYWLLKTFIAGCFFFLAGISCTFSRNNFNRGLRLLCIAVALTLVLYFAMEITILFGVLHFLAVSMILAPLFTVLYKKLQAKIATLLSVSVAIIILGVTPIVRQTTPPYPFMGIFGFPVESFRSADYFPLIPWFGIFLLGIVFGCLFYKEKRSLFHITAKPNFINYAGRYTLWVYLIHQPILIGLLWIILGSPF